MLGIFKDSKYLKRIKDETQRDPEHPRHHGIAMQAHHVISAKGIKLCGPGFGRKLAQFGYDINLLPNLVFLPSTLQGACHLGVQPHRGDHVTPFGGDENENDNDDEPIAYHEMVMVRVLEHKRLLAGRCPERGSIARDRVQEAMDSVSRKLITLIQVAPGLAPLTRVATSFIPISKTGCAGVDSVSNHLLGRCPVERNHEHSQGASQKSEGIAYRKPKLYQLKAGR